MNDTNNNGRRKKRVTTYCSVGGCSTYSTRGISFHHFPKDKKLKRGWEIALKMGKPSTQHMRVCSKHFEPSDYLPSRGKRLQLRPNAKPSRNLPVRSHDQVESSPQKRLKEARKKRANTRRNNAVVRPVGENVDVQEIVESENISDAKKTEPATYEKCLQANLSGKTVVKSSDERSLADILTDLNPLEKCCQADFLCEVNASDAAEEESHINLAYLLNTDKKLYTFTGLQSLDLLSGLIDCVSDIDPEPSTNTKILSLKERIVLNISKIKLNISFSALAVLFNVTRQTCSNYFKHTTPLLARVLKVVIPWPDHEDIRSNLPLSFQRYKHTRVILDCAESPIAKSKCLKCRVLTYSHSKKGNTGKFGVACAPSGLIVDVSDAFGGRASDKFIVNESGVLNKLNFKDGVMVDKGFRIDTECAQRHLDLIRPPFRRKKQQLSKEDALSTADIAKARVHVERVIQRLREFQLVEGPIPWPLAAYFDDTLTIAAGLTNLGPPVMNIDKYM